MKYQTGDKQFNAAPMKYEKKNISPKTKKQAHLLRVIFVAFTADATNQPRLFVKFFHLAEYAWRFSDYFSWRCCLNKGGIKW